MVEHLRGVEPPTYTLLVYCSAIEPQVHMELAVRFELTRAKPTAYKTVPIDLYGTPAL